MCGRFTLSEPDPQFLAGQLALDIGVDTLLTSYRPRYNIAPTDDHWIVRVKHEQRDLQAAKWGLINSWVKDPAKARPQINARAETALSSGAFKDAFARRRCVIPADGFFEWEGPRQSRKPIWFHHAEGQLLLFAGLYETWSPSPDVRQRTFTILTTSANGLLSAVHDRMPVILSESSVDAWLDPGNPRPAELASLLVPARDDLLLATPVSTLANSVKNDSPEVLHPREDVLPLL